MLDPHRIGSKILRRRLGQHLARRNGKPGAMQRALDLLAIDVAIHQRGKGVRAAFVGRRGATVIHPEYFAAILHTKTSDPLAGIGHANAAIA